jgi:signal transduction histidine kinase
MASPLAEPGAERLIAAVQELSLARDLPAIQRVVRCAARELTGADGATFVLREGTECHYLDEHAIAPLWKGRRFPLETCISGWVMQQRESVAIPDIYQDPRIPVDAYRPTFVKSLAMVPIRSQAPIGAIGNYWATPHTATPAQVRLLQALADSTSIALENARLYGELEQRVRDRTAELELANRDLAAAYRELESFSYAASHDLRAPVRAVGGFSRIVLEGHAGNLSDEGVGYLRRVVGAADRMSEMIDGLLVLSRATRASLTLESIDLAALADEILESLAHEDPDAGVEVHVERPLLARADRVLVRSLLENLLRNAWKFSSGKDQPVIEVGRARSAEGSAFFVRDNGAGFDMTYVDKLFTPFQRLHGSEFPGSGIGLATVQRVAARHGGRVWAEGKVDAGACIYFTLAPAPVAP